MASTNAHRELSALGEQLAAAQAAVAAAEERGWLSPPKPKPSASPPELGSVLRRGWRFSRPVGSAWVRRHADGVPAQGAAVCNARWLQQGLHDGDVEPAC